MENVDMVSPFAIPSTANKGGRAEGLSFSNVVSTVEAPRHTDKGIGPKIEKGVL